MKVFARTDIGKARERNEDFYSISEPGGEFGIFILADGMGGYNGGEIASRLATEATKTYIETNFFKIEYEKKEEILELIRNAMEYANKIVYEKAKQEEELEGMGTTLEVCLIYNNRAYIGHIGDSRIYRIRKGILQKLTQDHSYVQKLVKDGTITKEQALHHPKKNMLIKALGCTPNIEPDVLVKGFQEEDLILLCSDGLTNMVEEEEMNSIIQQDIENANKNLIQRANDLGGYDNSTVVILYNH